MIALTRGNHVDNKGPLVDDEGEGFGVENGRIGDEETCTTTLWMKKKWRWDRRRFRRVPETQPGHVSAALPAGSDTSCVVLMESYGIR